MLSPAESLAHRVALRLLADSSLQPVAVSWAAALEDGREPSEFTDSVREALRELVDAFDIDLGAAA